MLIRSGVTVVYNAFKSLTLMAVNKLPKLERLVFEVIDACNSRCKHCNIWRSKPTENILTPKEIEKIFSDNLFKDLKYIIITGGEPVLRNDIEDVILSIHKVIPNAKITLSTNGLLPQRVIDVVMTAIKNDICIDVGVSLDGIGEKHDFIRGVRGNFEKVDHLLRELSTLREGYKDKLAVTVGHTLSNLTADTLRETVAYAQRLNLGFLTQMYEEFPYYSNLSRIKQSSNYELIRAIQQLPPSLHNEILLKSLKRRKPVKFRCFSMRTFFLLRCNGDMTPCIRFSNNRVGNIREYSPSEIWHSTVAKEARNLVKSCKGCSNTWATDWSLMAWFLPFLSSIVRFLVKKETAKLRGQNKRGPL